MKAEVISEMAQALANAKEVSVTDPRTQQVDVFVDPAELSAPPATHTTIRPTKGEDFLPPTGTLRVATRCLRDLGCVLRALTHLPESLNLDEAES